MWSNTEAIGYFVMVCDFFRSSWWLSISYFLALCESLLQRRKRNFFFVSFPNTFLPKAVMLMMMMMFLSWRHHQQHHNCSCNCCSIFLARETQRTFFNSITSNTNVPKCFLFSKCKEFRRIFLLELKKYDHFINEWLFFLDKHRPS